MKKIALTLSIISAFFLLAGFSRAHAATTLFNNIGVGAAPNAPYGSNGGGCNITEIWARGVTQPTSTAGVARFANFNFASGTNQVTMLVQILDQNDAPLSATSSVDLTNFSTNTIVTVPISSPPTLTGGQVFKIATRFESNVPFVCDTGDFGMWWHNAQGSATPVDYLPDMSITDYDVAHPEIVQLLYPSEGLSTTDFQNFLVNWGGGTAGEGLNAGISPTDNGRATGTIEVFAGTSTSTLTSYGSIPWLFYYGRPIEVLKNFPLNRPGVLATSTWYAFARLSYATSTGGAITIVDSDVVSFTFNSNTQVNTSTYAGAAGVLPPLIIFENSTTTPQNPYTCTGISDIANCLLNFTWSAAQFLFVPNSNISSYMSNSLDTMKGVFPFSLVFGMHTAINTVAESVSSTTPTLSVVMPAPFSSSTPFVFLSSSSLVALVGASGKDAIFNLESAILWILLGLFIYHTVVGKKS